jgi:hypothetical protein
MCHRRITPPPRTHVITRPLRLRLPIHGSSLCPRLSCSARTSPAPPRGRVTTAPLLFICRGLAALCSPHSHVCCSPCPALRPRHCCAALHALQLPPGREKGRERTCLDPARHPHAALKLHHQAFRVPPASAYKGSTRGIRAFSVFARNQILQRQARRRSAQPRPPRISPPRARSFRASSCCTCSR